ncbi:hypothetical protein SBF1_3850004 [Candidatus Desulfosporosinus infrequens]|uniref:Uncharacterized protein n=1 Tax=Candidatus Desulfosporosinus infrequens TaxID=2043169 RepID=A0A2U3L6F6_9FIRM|nr:hypothetical protein SBF1_3850004 [Candidatus Desulfosporosinus infrequens]
MQDGFVWVRREYATSRGVLFTLFDHPEALPVSWIDCLTGFSTTGSPKWYPLFMKLVKGIGQMWGMR